MCQHLAWESTYNRVTSKITSQNWSWFSMCVLTPKKSQKSLPGPPGPECPKSLEESQKFSKKSQKETFPRFFETFWLVWRLFGHSGPRSPRRLFWDLEGPETPVSGHSDLKKLWLSLSFLKVSFQGCVMDMASLKQFWFMLVELQDGKGCFTDGKGGAPCGGGPFPFSPPAQKELNGTRPIVHAGNCRQIFAVFGCF